MLPPCCSMIRADDVTCSFWIFGIAFGVDLRIHDDDIAAASIRILCVCVEEERAREHTYMTMAS